MAVYKEEKTSTWRAVYRYTDWNGERKQTQKRGFKTKREAQAWEREQLNKTSADLDMTFKSFVDLYTADMKTRLKKNTWATKDHIIRTKLLPYFGRLKMCNITAQQIITWQNEMLNHKDENGKPYSPVYLKTVHNQLSAIFNHAVRYYNLRENPCKKAGSMGKKKNREMMFWTKEQYLKFAEVMMDKPLSFYAFEMLYWCGIREGELLALTPADFDFEKRTVTINKSYQRLNGQDLITAPKTEKSNRVITMPQFLAEEIQDYIKMLCEIADISTGNSNTNEAVEDGKYPFFVRSQEPLRKNDFEYDEAAIITAGDGVGVGKVYHYIEGKYALHQRAYRIHINTSEVMAVSRVAATSGTPQVPARR